MYELAKWIWEHKNQPITWATALSFMWLILDKLGRKLINSQLKRLFRIRQKSEFAKYIENQTRIESKVDLLLEERGLKWDARYVQTSKQLTVTDGQRNSLLLSCKVLLHAITIGAFTTQTDRSNHSKTKGESIRMKSKLLSRKLWMTILGSVVLVLNQQLGWDLNADSIIGIGSLLISFILGQSIVDTNGIGQFAPLLEKLKSSKLWVSLIGSVIIGLNDQLQWGMSPENIYTMVGLAVTFIIGKSTVSFSQAKKSAFDETKSH